ncbi:TetR/AcrR family transcriptional regulator [Paenibacillus sp. An7]|uniref:TetR/AcrR family transcriptional regulator n=1 Tax=Paenibacillus sp. An7 TaxID=2689577 RepID=UPI00135713C8|nr:TetR-like C-terminal domain-containing protein [Paenibacillus sp. An7]
MAPRNGINLHKILLAATEIIDTNGLEELTLASLAQKLDIRSPSLYNHFDGLHDIRRLLSIYGLEQLLSALMRAAVGRSGDEAIREMAKAYISFARAHPGLYEVTLIAPAYNDDDLHKVGQEIVDLVTQVLEAYQMEKSDTIHIARALRSHLHGFASLEQRGGFGMPIDLDESFMHMIDTFLAGLHIRYPQRSE